MLSVSALNTQMKESLICWWSLTSPALQSWRRWCGHLHGQSIRSSEWVTIPHDEGARLSVLQERDSCMRTERGQMSVKHRSRPISRHRLDRTLFPSDVGLVPVFGGVLDEADGQPVWGQDAGEGDAERATAVRTGETARRHRPLGQLAVRLQRRSQAQLLLKRLLQDPCSRAAERRAVGVWSGQRWAGGWGEAHTVCRPASTTNNTLLSSSTNTSITTTNTSMSSSTTQ